MDLALTQFRPPYHGRRSGGFGGGHPMMYQPGMGMGMGMGMNMGMHQHPHLPPGLEAFGMPGFGGLSGHGGLGMNSMMFGGGMPYPRSRRSPYYDMYGGGRSSSRYGFDPYDMFEDMFDDEFYMDDYEDIEDPLLLFLRMNQRGGGGGGRRGRRGRRYGGGGGGMGWY